jgi:protease-4
MVWPFKPRFRKQIARIEITGAIASGTRKHVLEALKTVEERKFPALLLRIDSPGGTVGDSQEIYSALKRLREKVKIVASFGNISASGGVYIGMGAQHIMANPGTITGSIGVILRGNNLERLLQKIGVSFKVIKSGPYKDLGIVDRLGTEEDARRWAAELVELDPEKTPVYTLEERKPLLSRILPGSRQVSSGLGAGINWVEFEVSTNGLPLWMYRP